MHSKTVGEMNGYWARLFKVTLTLIPLILLWGAWVTQCLFDIRQEIVESHAEYNTWIAAYRADSFNFHDWERERRLLVSTLPSQDRLKAMELRIEKLEGGG